MPRKWPGALADNVAIVHYVSGAARLASRSLLTSYQGSAEEGNWLPGVMEWQRGVIVNEEQRRAMDFIAAANRGGYRPTGREINQWRRAPAPKPARKCELLEPEIPAVPERRVRTSPTALATLIASQGIYGNATYDALVKSAFSDINATILQSVASAIRVPNWLGQAEYDVIPGKPGRPAVYAPDKPPEKFLAHLRRLGWVERNNSGRYGVTLLGEALLKADALEESDFEDSSVMVLAAGDQNLGYGQVLGRIADSGDALVVDGYLGAQELAHILEHTNASRFLIGDKLARGRITELAIQIRFAPPSSTGAVRELRKASFHDRYLIGEHKVYTLTASLNGVGKSSMAVLMEMTDVAARAIRAEVENWWVGGEVVATGLTTEPLTESIGGTGEAEVTETIRLEDDRYLHDGCAVRHRTQRAAENCTNGT